MSDSSDKFKQLANLVAGLDKLCEEAGLMKASEFILSESEKHDDYPTKQPFILAEQEHPCDICGTTEDTELCMLATGKVNTVYHCEVHCSCGESEEAIWCDTHTKWELNGCEEEEEEEEEDDENIVYKTNFDVDKEQENEIMVLESQLAHFKPNIKFILGITPRPIVPCNHAEILFNFFVVRYVDKLGIEQYITIKITYFHDHVNYPGKWLVPCEIKRLPYHNGSLLPYKDMFYEMFTSEEMDAFHTKENKFPYILNIYGKENLDALNLNRLKDWCGYLWTKPNFVEW